MSNIRTPFRGFDSEFTDIDHYIRVITHRIWEERQIDDIRRYYSDPCIIETPSTVTSSIEDVINGTRATLEMFPDRRLLAEDIITSGDDEHGFLSSHRIISPMTHRGPGAFGAPTDTKIYARTIADCVCKKNRIVHEWLVRDHAAIAIQLGMRPQALAQLWLDQRGGWHKPIAGAAPDGYVSSQSTHKATLCYANAIANAAHRNSHAVDIYDEAVEQHAPGGRTHYGVDDVSQYWRSLFEALRVDRFEVEHLAFMPCDQRPDRAAMRWRATTTHSGTGDFGAPTGKKVEVLGINHVEFVDNKVLREWVLIDDVALWMQILDLSVD